MKNLSDTKLIDKYILEYLRLRGEGSYFSGIALATYVLHKLEKYKYMDTVLHGLRYLRLNGVIDYSSVGQKRESKYYLKKV